MTAMRVRVSVLALLLSAACSFAPLPPLERDAGDDDPSVDGGDGPDAPPSPNLTRVFFTARPSGVTGVYYVDVVDGDIGDAIRLSAPPANPNASLSVQGVSADGRTILYGGTPTTTAVEAYVTWLDETGTPTPPARIHEPPDADSYVVGTWLAPDGARAIYAWGQYSQVGVLTTDYYAVALSRGTPSTPIALDGGDYVSSGALSPDGRWFAYVETGGVFIVDLGGATPSAPILLAAIDSDVFVSHMIFAADSSRLAFAADLVANDQFELFVVDTSGATPGEVEKASGPLAPGASVSTGGLSATPVASFDPSGKKLAYVVDQPSTGPLELFVVDVSGATPGAARRVNDTLVTGGSLASDIFTVGYKFAPDGEAIAYLADQRTDEVVELFVVDVTGDLPGPAQRISGALVTGGDVSGFQFAPSSNGISYRADQRIDDQMELFYVDLSQAQPSAAQLVNGPLTEGASASGAAFSRDGATLAYTASENGGAGVHLVDVATGTPSPTRLLMPSAYAIQFSHADSDQMFWSSGASGDHDLWTVALPDGEPLQVNVERPVMQFSLWP